MLKQRVMTALVLVLLTGSALFYASDNVWKGALLLVALLAAWEWASFAKIEIPVLKMIYAFGVLVTANFAINMLSVENILLLAILQIMIALRLVHRYQFSKATLALGSTGFVALSGALFIVLFVVVLYKFRVEFGALTLLLSMLLIWAIDSGAYFSGRKFGKTKLAQYVSPGKTWEGVWGGALLSFVSAVIVLISLGVEGFVSVIGFAIILTFIALLSVYGDLYESVLKRQNNLKDSGKILPGHGGVLDRVDSLLIAMPLFYLAWYYFLQA